MNHRAFQRLYLSAAEFIAAHPTAAAFVARELGRFFGMCADDQDEADRVNAEKMEARGFAHP